MSWAGQYGTARDGVRFHHHAARNGTRSKPYELFISGIFYLIFTDPMSLWVTETMESETADKGRPLSKKQKEFSAPGLPALGCPLPSLHLFPLW